MPPVASSCGESTIGWRRIGLVLILTFVIRSTVVCVLPAGLSIDTDGYRRLAITLRTTGTYGFGAASESNNSDAKQVAPTAYRPPLYPLLLTLLVVDGRLSPIAVGALHVALGCGTVALTLWLGHAWGLGRWTLLAAMLTACDPILLHQTAQIMTESLATFSAAAALVLLTLLLRFEGSNEFAATLKSSGSVVSVGMSAGFVLGLTCLCRPTFLPWCGLIVLGVLAKRWKDKSTTVGFALVCGMIAALAPWGLRNYLAFGHFKVSTTHGGYTLLLGNNPSFYRYLREAPRGAVWQSDELDLVMAREPLSDGEFGSDRLAYRWAREHIRAEPRMFVWACCVRVARLWNVLPHRLSDKESLARSGLRFATALWYLATYGLLVFAIVQCRPRLLHPPWLWGVLLCVTFTAVHALYWSDMRMRAPLMPYLYVVVGAGLAKIERRK